MSWIIPAAGLFLLIVLALSVRSPKTRFHPEAALGDALPAYLTAVSQRSADKGYSRWKKPRKLLERLEKAISFLNTLPAEELLPAARWLCENGRFLQEEALVCEDCWRGTPLLPRFEAKKPRLMVFAQEMLLHCSANVTQERLRACVEAWQSASAFANDEWHVMDAALRRTLLELLCELADECVQTQRCSAAALQTHRLLESGKRRRAKRLFERYAHAEAYQERLFGLLTAERPQWFKDFHATQETNERHLRDQVQARCAENCLWIANAISSLRLLSKLPWAKLCEEWSLTHSFLLQDPVYAAMDEESRCFYRDRTGCIAKAARRTEHFVCTTLLSLCRSARPETLEAHTGYYLLDEGSQRLFRQLKSPFLFFRLNMLTSHTRCTVFRLASWFFFAAFAALAIRLHLFPLFWLPFAAVMLYSTQQLIVHITQNRVQPRMVPRIRMESLSDSTQTLVVFPTMLTDAAHALAMAKRLSIAHQANPDPHLHFLLLGDFQDSMTGTLSSDASIIQTASAAIEALCEDTGHPFFYMQRERVYVPAERIYHSRERKRGGLETLLRLMEGRSVEDSFAFSSVPPQRLHGLYRYVIALDSDTILSPGSALRMIGAMQHPLQKRMRRNGVLRGVSILQPRMETAAHTVSTALAELLGSAGGTDPYNQLSASFDADVLGRGTFCGKGIIDPKPFLDATESNILKGSVLSHDLLEGELAGCAQASDIVLYDGNPQTLKGFMYRLHRWTRGDWQLLPYVLPFFPRQNRPQRKLLSSVSRFKIWRNLFRSMVAPLRFALMLYAAFTGRDWLFWSTLLLPEAPFVFPLSLAGFKSLLCRLCVLPCEAVIQADAIGRTIYRLWFSRRRLLEWTTSAQVAGQNGTPMLFFNASMTAAGLLAFAMLLRRTVDPALLLPAVLWAVFPFWLPVLERVRTESHSITPYMRDVFLRLAQSTLTFFETAITQEDHALPPDNVQLDPNTGIAHRTSPTNIGLYLCSLAASEKLRLLSPDDMAQRMEETVATLEQLPKWKGQLYNWYDTRTLAPLPPAFVSSVDCGNLAVCLMTCAQAVRSLLPELNAAHSRLPARLDALVEAMDFAALYDWDADLFFIGVNPADNTPSGTHYDLLASESRLLSLAAIMLGHVPVRHWYRLGRPQIRTRYGYTLLSSSGTMFEYLMPLLFQQRTRGTLLDHACRTVVKVQRSVRHAGAYGISESGYYAFDRRLQYQYKAFGIPLLALSAESSDQVLAPYASLLSAPLYPKAAFANVQRLASLGLSGPLGLFEAADFNRADGQRMRIVRSHMAHHQGMILCSICNLLEDNALVSLFSSLPRAQAYRLLLEEKAFIPRRTIHKPLKPPVPAADDSPYCMQRCVQPLRFPIEAHILHGAETTLIVDAQGCGGIRENSIAWTRFSECCTQPGGVQLYLRDSESGAYWSATNPHLLRSIRFETAQVIFEHERFDVSCELRIWINPLDGTVLHCLRLQNSAAADRMMEVCSYLEPALTSQSEASAHPAFQNLFIRTQRLGKQGLTAIRRPRERDEPQRQLWHMLASDAPFTVFRMQTDRTVFLGRTRSPRNPRALEHPISAAADSLGDVIDPCLSLRGQFTVPAKGCTTLIFSTRMAHSDDRAHDFYERYRHVQSIMHSYDAALTSGMVCVRSLGLDAETQALVSRLPGTLVYSGQPHQYAYTAGNTLPVSELWSLGISGNLPLWVVECCGNPDAQNVELALKAHALWQENGFPTDLIFLTDSAHTAALAAQCIAASPVQEHVYSFQQLEESKAALLRASARLVLHASYSFSAQLDALAYDLRTRLRFSCPSPAAWKTALPEADPLAMENGYGGFTKEGNYQILLAPGRQTPAPWCNPLCNPQFGSLASESGLVFTYAKNSHSGRLTRWSNDPVLPAGDEQFFLRDAKDKLLWSLTRMPLGHKLPVRITHAPGETVYESCGYGVYSRLLCFTDSEYPLGFRVMYIRNESDQKRELTLFHTCRFALGTHPNEAALTALSCAQDRVWIRNPCMEGAACMAAVDPRRCAVRTLSAGVFQGTFSQLPFALSAWDQPPQEEGDTALLSFTLVLEPGESCSLSTALLYGQTREAVSNVLEHCRREGSSSRLRKMRQSWESRLGKLRFDLPNPGLSLLLTRWLPYQVQASRLWMRAGFYQAGGAIGFRDQLQDVLSLLHTHPSEARKHILLCAAHQFEEGDVQHWWHPPRHGVRTRISDDKLFLPYVASLYAAIAGDDGLMEERVPYLHGDVLTEGESERYFTPEVSETCESLREHCLRAIHSVELGAHGLPLMGSGDWNDGMNRVGGEHGESVWLGMFLCEVIRMFLPYCAQQEQESLSILRSGVLEALDCYAWDGAWYLRGWYSSGKPLGSSNSGECEIDLLSQSWSALCGTDPERSGIAMEHALRILWDRSAGIFKLFSPPFDGKDHPGYIAGYLPGIRENGGQYTHAACWGIAALHRLGRSEDAWKIAQAILPIAHSQSRQHAVRYRSEPYVMAADIYANPQQYGRGGWTWYTGSAGWYLTVVLVNLLGFEKRGNRLRFHPTAPESWEQLTLTYQYGNTTYHLHASRDCREAQADGEKLPDGQLILLNDGKIHEAVFPLK